MLSKRKSVVLWLVAAIVTASLNVKAGHQDKDFNALVALHCQVTTISDGSVPLDFDSVSAKLITKVNELTRKKKVLIQFEGNEEAGGNPGTVRDLYLDITIRFSQDVNTNGVNVYYSDDNDYAFQSIKYANMVVSEIKSSRLKLKVNGMTESGEDRLKNAPGPALLVDVSLMNTDEAKALLTNEDKLNELAKMIFECIERISKS